MSADHLDDDENVKAMRETARTIGLTQLIVDAYRIGTTDDDQAEALYNALRLLGVPIDERTLSLDLSGFLNRSEPS